MWGRSVHSSHCLGRQWDSWEWNTRCELNPREGILGIVIFKMKGKGEVLHSKEVLSFTAGREVGFGRHPSFRLAALQVRHHQKCHIPGALFGLCHAETWLRVPRGSGAHSAVCPTEDAQQQLQPAASGSLAVFVDCLRSCCKAHTTSLGYLSKSQTPYFRV